MRRTLAAAVVAAGMAAAPAMAHHSGAMFDQTKTMTVEGTVKAVQWSQPHVWISVIGSPDGKGEAAQWDVEAIAPVRLVQIGLRKEMMEPGAKIALLIHPIKDGRRAGSFVAATLDGKTYSFTASPTKSQ
jgi:hypothetical protein